MVDFYWKNISNKEDKIFLKKILNQFKTEIQLYLLVQYEINWESAYRSETVEHKKDNAGRFNANKSIRQEVFQMRTEEPELVKKYKEVIKNGPPKCCHTCAYYNKIGECTYHRAAPPDEFTIKLNVCEAWEIDIPF